MKRLLIMLLMSYYALNSYAIDTHRFSNAEQQTTYETLTNQLRCLVCQNQTIADSNADLAKDLREQIFIMLQQGQSKTQIIQFMTDRYGDFVLYKPPFNATTSLLWLAPALFLIIGVAAILLFIRTKKSQAAQGINTEKLAQAKHLLQQGNDH